MSFLLAIESTILVIVVVYTLLLGYVVITSNPKSATNKIFVALSLVMSAWAVVIHFSLEADNAHVLFWIRLSIALAALMSSFFYLLAKTIPSDKITMKKGHVLYLAILTLAIMLVCLSSLAFTGATIASGTVTPTPGFGLVFFGLFVIITSGGAVSILWKRQKIAKNLEKLQLRSVMNGILLMYLLMIFVIFLPLALFSVTTFVPLFPAVTLVFTGMTAYGIVNYRLFNLKIITVEALTVALWATLFSKISTSNRDETIVNILIFTASIVFGLLLIRSVRSEVSQREQLEVLTKELEYANSKLQVLDKARAEFISIASHQLRTPPATIKWYLAAMHAGDFGPISGKFAAALEKVELTNNGLISLIEDLLNVSRIERGKMEFLFEYTDVQSMADQLLVSLTPQATMKKLKLVYKKPRIKLPQILADREKLQQVINNLIDNAIKYSKKGTVTLELSKTATDIVIKVKDTGKGLTLEEKKTIFEKFGRGEDSQKSASGLGLGLYVAKVIVEHHKGKIWAESPGENKGTTFFVSLPIKSDLKAEIFDLTKVQ